MNHQISNQLDSEQQAANCCQIKLGQDKPADEVQYETSGRSSALSSASDRSSSDEENDDIDETGNEVEDRHESHEYSNCTTTTIKKEFGSRSSESTSPRHCQKQIFSVDQLTKCIDADMDASVYMLHNSNESLDATLGTETSLQLANKIENHPMDSSNQLYNGLLVRGQQKQQSGGINRLSSSSPPSSASSSSSSSPAALEHSKQSKGPAISNKADQSNTKMGANSVQTTYGQSNDDIYDEVKHVDLFGVKIVALTINGKERLCLAQISNTLLKDFNYNEIHNRRVALGITCVQCTPIQLEMLRRAGAMPSSSRRCGMITMREAERLCRSFLAEEQPPELPEDFYFTVGHRVNYGCKGRFIPARYISSRAKCIECCHCGEFYSPNKFIFHSHKQPNATDCNPPDSPNINSWRKHINLDWSLEHSQEIKYAWEDVKSLFNGGTRRRPSGPMMASGRETSQAAGYVEDQDHSGTGSNNSGKPITATSLGNKRRKNAHHASVSQRDLNEHEPIDVEFDGEAMSLNSSNNNNNNKNNNTNKPLVSQRSSLSNMIGSSMSQNERRKLSLNWSLANQTGDRSSSAAMEQHQQQHHHHHHPQQQQEWQSKDSVLAAISQQRQSTNSLSQNQNLTTSMPRRTSPCNTGSGITKRFLTTSNWHQSKSTLASPPSPTPASPFQQPQQHHRQPDRIFATDRPTTTTTTNDPYNLPFNSATGMRLFGRQPSAHHNLMTSQAAPTPTSASNFIYSQLYSHLMQSQISQQVGLVQQQQQLTPMEAQLALRHQIWSSLLANLRPNLNLADSSGAVDQQATNQQTYGLGHHHHQRTADTLVPELGQSGASNGASNISAISSASHMAARGGFNPMNMFPTMHLYTGDNSNNNISTNVANHLTQAVISDAAAPGSIFVDNNDTINHK